MFDLLLTALALLFIAAMALIGLGALLLPAYFWALWRTDAELAEARRLKLLD